MIRCADRDAQFIFYLKDVDMSILKASAQKGSGKKASAAAVAASATKPFVGMEVDFAAVANPRGPAGALHAARVKCLPKGTVELETTIASGVRGVVVKAVTGPSKPKR